MTIFAVDIHTLSGGPADMDRCRGRVVLVVNVADGDLVAVIEKPLPR